MEYTHYCLEHVILEIKVYQRIKLVIICKIPLLLTTATGWSPAADHFLSLRRGLDTTGNEPNARCYQVRL